MKRWMFCLCVAVAQICGMEQEEYLQLPAIDSGHDLSVVLQSDSGVVVTPTKKKRKKRKKKQKKKMTSGLYVWSKPEKDLDVGEMVWYQELMGMMGQEKGSSLSQAEEYFRSCEKLDIGKNLKADQGFLNWVNKDLFDVALIASSEEAPTSKVTDEQRLALYTIGRFCLEGDNGYAKTCRKDGWKRIVSQSNGIVKSYYHTHPCDFIRYVASMGDVSARLYLATSEETGFTPCTRVSHLSKLWPNKGLSKKDKEIVREHMDHYAQQGYFTPLMVNVLQAINQDEVDDYFKALDEHFPPVIIRSIDRGIHKCDDSAYEALDAQQQDYWSAKAIASCLRVIRGSEQACQDEGGDAIEGMLTEICAVEELWKQHSELQYMLGSCYSLLGDAYEKRGNMEAVEVICTAAIQDSEDALMVARKDAKAIRTAAIQDALGAHEEAMKHAGDDEDVLIPYTKILFNRENVTKPRNKTSKLEEICKDLITIAVNRKIEAYLLYASFYSFQNKLEEANGFLEKARLQMDSECNHDKYYASKCDEVNQEVQARKSRKKGNGMKMQPLVKVRRGIEIINKSRGALGQAQQDASSKPLEAASSLIDAAHQYDLFWYLNNSDGRGMYDAIIAAMKEAKSNLDNEKQAELQRVLEELS